ncbi:tRNA threonylcarbamoyladenosine dehydratase [Desulfomicrobium escambiense]|uniref:tRNA threonylcarbamoyladenosine dehydratase n=1 Tax=Desulfomicrobium escambiense TaxID=29503 RepID=UPI0004048FE7|nr:tRNA threonylcarbamoyladenosine dehydratase [Desulfomicrobium escambiense]
MMRFARTMQLIGEDGLARLQGATVAVFGLGAVGSYVVEALARAGVGSLVLFDHDVVSASNINRQLFALHSTIGRPKAEVARERVLDINPDCAVEARIQFVDGDNVAGLMEGQFDVVVDAIDGVNSKVNLIVAAREKGLEVVASMGAAAKLDPSKIRAADISKSFMCPLAQIIRKRLRRRGVTAGVRCVFSTEAAQNKNEPVIEEAPEQGVSGRPRAPIGSISYLTGMFGLYVASEVVGILLGEPIATQAGETITRDL